MSGEGLDSDSSLTELTSPHQYFCFDAGSLGFYYGYDNIPKHLSQLLFLAPSQIWRKKMFSVKASTFPAFPQVATRPGLPSDLNSFPSSDIISWKPFVCLTGLSLSVSSSAFGRRNPFHASLTRYFTLHGAVRSWNP